MLPIILRITLVSYYAQVIQRAIYERQRPLQYLTEAGYTVFSQMDVCYPEKKICAFPQVGWG